MEKEILIVCIILTLIIVINITCQNYLSKVIDETNNKLNNIAETSTKYLNNQIDYLESKNIVNKEMNNLKESWSKYKKKLSLYIEHDELEKVDTTLVRISSFIDIDDYEEVIPESRECIFILEHIKEKEKISLANLF